MRRISAVPILLIITLLGSGAAAAQSTPSGEVLGLGGRVEVPEAGYALTLPDGWVSVRPSQGDIGVILDEVRNQLPELGPTIEAALGSGLGFSLLALDSGSDPTFTRNRNVLDRPSEGMTIDAIGAEELAKLAVIGDVIIDGPELSFVFETSSTAYLLTDATWVHTLTCTDLARPDDGWLSIAESLELLPSGS